MSKSEGHGSFFWLQVSEMSEMISLNMGVNFATSLNMGGKFKQKLYVKTCRNAISGHAFHVQYIRFIQNKEILNTNHDYAMLRSK